MKKAVKEISRRREVQKEYNKKNNITPKAVVKAIRDWPFASAKEIATTEFGLVNDINLLEKEMKKAAEELDFERAAELRDLIKKTKGDKDKTYANNSIGKKSASKKLKKS
jgi:excinuclease ABC subunit B